MRTLIGLVIILLVILGIVWYVQKDSSVVSNLFKRNSSSEISPTPENGQENQAGTPVSQDQLTTCTAELLAMDCASAEQTPVCSSDTVVRSDGSEERTRAEYISACHYCRFFGSDNVAEFGDEKITTQGYTNGACTVSEPPSEKGGN